MDRLAQELSDLRIIDLAKVREFYPCVRDRSDVRVMRCDASGVIFLERSDHISAEHYKSHRQTDYWAKNRSLGLLETREDDTRRYRQFGDYLAGANWLDVGCGLGGLLEMGREISASASGVEPQPDVRKYLLSQGFTIYDDLREISQTQTYDTITMLHVFEHMVEPLRNLTVAHDRLAPGGTLILEVPHANDILLQDYNVEAFKKFTLWSEHLVLHTRGSLTRYLQTAGFEQIVIRGYQRFPLANHLHWILAGSPGGHKKLAHMRAPGLETEYAGMLGSLDRTDTLIAIARKSA